MKIYRIQKVTSIDDWSNIMSLNDFSYPWRDEDVPKTLFKGYHDGKYLYFKFKAFCSLPLVYVENNNKLEVTRSERVELFFRKDEKMMPYYCLEMDPTGRVLDYRANYYREFDRNWQWPEQLAIKTKIEEQYYTLEGKISFSILKELALLNNSEIQAGIYRGHCTEIKEKESSIKWISWVDSKTEKPDFHVPSSFGTLKLEQ